MASITAEKIQVKWHLSCYKNYTHKTMQATSTNFKLGKRSVEDEESVQRPKTLKVKTRSTDKIFSWKRCLICQNIYHKNVKKTMKIRTLSGQQNIFTQAEKKNDHYLLMQIHSVGGELIYSKRCLLI